MSKPKILIADDDPQIRSSYQFFINKFDYKIHLAEDGKEALELIQKEKSGFNLLITDLDMPGMVGSSLIDQVKDSHREMVIIVISSHDESEIIIEVMRKGIFDYMVKPVEKEEFQLKVKRALDRSFLLKEKIIYEKERVLRLENQLNWFNYKEQLKTSNNFNQEEIKRTLFTNLKTHLGQGIGFGLLTSIAEMILMSPKNTEGQFLVDPDIIEILKTNSDYARDVLKYFDSLEKIYEEGVPLEKVGIEEIYSLLSKMKESKEIHASTRKQKIIISDKKNSVQKFIKTNRQYFKEIVGELLTNAIKYSELESTIAILFDLREMSLNITILNKPFKFDESDKEGIPEEYQNLIFEPFFRIHKAITEEMNSLNYGLGLTKVKTLLNKMGANIQVSNINDYSENQRSVKVAFTLSFPFAD